MVSGSRSRAADKLRRTHPGRLAEWDGFEIAGQTINPCADFRRAHFKGEPRDIKLAELLIGDIFVQTLLDDEVIVYFSNQDRREWVKPFACAARREAKAS